MKKRNLIRGAISALFICLVLPGFGQIETQNNTLPLKSKRIKRIGIDGGVNFHVVEPNALPYIRSDINSYYDYDNGSSALGSSMYGGYGSVKVEVLFAKNILGVSSGVRYSYISSTIEAISSSEPANSSGFFYLNYSQDNLNTYYARVKSIRQSSNYIGIPLELRCYPLGNRLFNLYFKVGSEFSYLFNTTNRYSFYNESMESETDEIDQVVGKPESFYTSIYPGAGIRVGKIDKPGFSIEALFPSFILSTNYSSLVQSSTFIGFQFNAQFPF